MSRLIATAFATDIAARFSRRNVTPGDWSMDTALIHFYSPQDPYIERDIGQDFGRARAAV